MRLSDTRFELNLPYWQDYHSFLQRLAGRNFPGCNQLNAMLPDGLSSQDGHAIRFVPSTQLSDAAYEQRIYTTGQVSTRPQNWHDLFNSLVWMRFPRIKTAINTLHYHAWSEQKGGSRGCLRDALTLFDECGVIVCSNQLKILKALAGRRWTGAFLDDGFCTSVRVVIVGHAMLEKYLSPYKSMTAKALLVHTDTDFLKLGRQEILSRLDSVIAQRMLGAELLTRPARLAPLPLAGVPGWWPVEEQGDGQFYNDLQVFRPPLPDLEPAPVFKL